MKEINRLKFNEPQKFKKKTKRTSLRLRRSLVRRSIVPDPPPKIPHSQLEKVKNDLEEGGKLISERQKHLSLAGKSDYGWAKVVEYKKQRDSLLDDSDDETRVGRICTPPS